MKITEYFLYTTQHYSDVTNIFPPSCNNKVPPMSHIPVIKLHINNRFSSPMLS